jgi:cobalt-zinc-cadmium efflux system outer membrane protein
MNTRHLWAFFGFALVCGCSYHTQEQTDLHLSEVVAHAFDPGPPSALEVAPGPTKPVSMPLASAGLDVQTTAFMQGKKEEVKDIMSRLKVPDAVPGSETPLIRLPDNWKELTPAQREAVIKKYYPELPALPEPPQPVSGPDGQPYTLCMLQSIAAANSPALREAAANVEQARGNYIQAGAYPNPTVGVEYTPSNDGSTPGADGFFVDQVVVTNGKLKLAAAAAEMSLHNAELALKRARSDLSTAVRNAYYALLVARETVRVNLALAQFTDDVYRIQLELLKNGFSASYEPAALRAQTWTIRLSLKQSIDTYMYSWKQLVSTVGLRQLPLSEVAGRIDRAIPFYDYDTVLAHVLKHHTDMLTAYNGIDLARYNLKAAQVTPIPNVEFNVGVLKDFSLAPHQIVPTATVSFPLPVWDRNKGNIIAAEAALVTASEEPHRVEVTLTHTLATNYLSYKTNLESLEYYRRYILPDQVRYYRGVYDRRRIDPNSAFGDLVQAQQTLASNVQTYLGILSSLWTATISVADMLQTDDLFQLGTPHELPELPDLEHLRPWLCIHPCNGMCAHGPVSPFVPAVTLPNGQALPSAQALNPTMAGVKGQTALPQLVPPQATAAPASGQPQSKPAPVAPLSGQRQPVKRLDANGQTLQPPPPQPAASKLAAKAGSDTTVQPVKPPQPPAQLPTPSPDNSVAPILSSPPGSVK